MHIDKNSRRYSWEVVLYCEVEELRSVLDKYSKICHFLYVLHDRDITLDSDGNIVPVKPHIHLFCTFKREISRSLLAKELNFYLSRPDYTVLANNIEPIKTTLSDCADYARHIFEPDKAQYREDELFSDNFKFFRRSKGSNRDIGWQIFEDLENGTSLRSMAVKYGREFILNYSRYKDFLEAVNFFDRNVQPDDDVELSSPDEQLSFVLPSSDS